MNRKSLRKKFNALSVVAAVIPLMVVVYMLFQSSDPLGSRQLVLPVVGYALFLCCLIFLVYIANSKFKSLAVQLEKFHQESQKRASELNALRDIYELTKNAIPADDLLKLILDKAMQVIDVRNGSVFLVDSGEPDGLRLVASNPEVVINSNHQTPRRFSFVKSVIESGKAMRIQDIEKDPRTMKSNDPKYGSPSFISMPVYKNRQVIAVMNLANKENGGIFTESDERILTIMLGAIGFGIENIGLQNKINQLMGKKELTAGVAK